MMNVIAPRVVHTRLGRRINTPVVATADAVIQI